jgi:hypothetical protein
MGNEMQVYECTDMAVARQPETVLAEAQTAAKSLQKVISGKSKPVVFNGEQYLEFEDWQTVARFYGVTAKVIATQFVDFGGVQGFEAHAVAIRNDGVEISGADSMCLNDEPNWKNKPLFQLRSMAQTRACAKALRNVLAWVVVLAGYKPTPAEEMQGVFNGNGSSKPPIQQPQEKSAAPVENTVTVGVKDVSFKDGEKNGKPYRIFGIADENGTTYKTFSETFAADATTAMNNGLTAVIHYKEGKYGNDIIDLTVEA